MDVPVVGGEDAREACGERDPRRSTIEAVGLDPGARQHGGSGGLLGSALRAAKTLGRRREVYAEILPMVQRHYRRVPLSWIYAFSKEAAKSVDTGKTWSDGLRFAAKLAVVGTRTFVQYNGRVPLPAWLRRRQRDTVPRKV